MQLLQAARTLRRHLSLSLSLRVCVCLCLSVCLFNISRTCRPPRVGVAVACQSLTVMLCLRWRSSEQGVQRQRIAYSCCWSQVIGDCGKRPSKCCHTRPTLQQFCFTMPSTPSVRRSIEHLHGVDTSQRN